MTEQPLTSEQEIQALRQELTTSQETIESLVFYSSPIQFNSTLFKGFKLVLDKLMEIDKTMREIEVKISDKQQTKDKDVVGSETMA